MSDNQPRELTPERAELSANRYTTASTSTQTEADEYITDDLEQALRAAKVKPSQIRSYLLGVTECSDGLKNWTREEKSAFAHCLGSICRVPTPALAFVSGRINVGTQFGEVSIKDRFVIPVVLHPNHMDVLLISTSSGRGGVKLSDAQKATCIGFKKAEDQNYVNLFPNPPVQISKDSKYPAKDGAWTDVTYTYPVAYDTRVEFTDDLPNEEADYIMDLFQYFRSEKIFTFDHRFIDREFLDEQRAWYNRQLDQVHQDKMDRADEDRQEEKNLRGEKYLQTAMSRQEERDYEEERLEQEERYRQQEWELQDEDDRHLLKEIRQFVAEMGLTEVL
jgi:hypothetical protein